MSTSKLAKLTLVASSLALFLSTSYVPVYGVEEPAMSSSSLPEKQEMLKEPEKEATEVTNAPAKEVVIEPEKETKEVKKECKEEEIKKNDEMKQEGETKKEETIKTEKEEVIKHENTVTKEAM